MDSRFEYRLETVLPFKKHKGQKLKDVIDSDIEYVKWLHRQGANNPAFDFRLGKMALDYLIEKNDENKKNLYK